MKPPWSMDVAGEGSLYDGFKIDTPHIFWRQKMEIPLQAQVECTDGICGRSVYVLIEPLIDQVTHLVVKEDLSPNTEYIVPVDVISTTIADTIRLRCSKAELGQMKPFVKMEFVPLSAMDDSGDDTLFMNMDKQQIESLPTFPVHRLWY